MKYKEISELLAQKFVEIINKYVNFEEKIKQKDNLTDVAQNLSVVSGSNNGSVSSGSPTLPTGAVVASDGSIVTLGLKGPKDSL